MKFLQLFLISGFMSAIQPAFANCTENLTDGYTRDSKALFLSATETADFYTNELNPSSATEAVKRSLAKVGCSSNELKPQDTIATCRSFRHSVFTVCMVENNQIGYFFVSKDMLDGINVVFNRWD